MPKTYEEKYEKPLELGTIFDNRLNDLKSEIKVQLPCKVQSVDYINNQVAVEILDYDYDNIGNAVPYPIIPNVPIRQPQDSGKAYIRLPIQVGDIGTIEFFDSSVDDLLTISNFSYDESEEWHSLNNGIFTNGFLPKNKYFEYDYNSKIVIGTKTNKFILKVNNSDQLELEAVDIDIKSANTISIKAPAGMSIDTPDLSVTGDVTVGSGVSGVVACQSQVLTITNGIITGIT